MNLHDLTDALLGLAVIAAAVILVVLFGRDPKANEHDLSDYHEPTPVVPSFSFTLAERGLAQMRDDLAADDILPPAPPGMNAGSPLYAGMLFDTWHPENPAEAAARFLREVGEEARAKAGIRPAYATDRRDMVGAFPVVRAAA